MSIKVHHLNCGTMCPFCEPLVNGQGSWRKPGTLVCHCLLIETPTALVLVDTGLGLRDIQEPRRRLGTSYPPLFKPKLAKEEAAISQVKALGYDPRDVRHILPTHVDLDHVGGLSDFPEAEVHIYKPELEQLLRPGWRERTRYRWAQFEHRPRWHVHEDSGERWFGFAGIRAIPGLPADILMIPLVGHTRGHVGVAVRTGDRWLLHCGDAYYHHSQLTARPTWRPAMNFFEWYIQSRPLERLRNQARLRRLATQHADAVELFCSHDPVELARYGN